MRVVPSLVALSLAAAPLPLAGQSSAAQHLGMGDSAHAALQPDAALRHYEAVLTADSANYEALWKAAREVVDIAKQIEGDAEADKRRRDSLYTAARAYAEAAVRVNADGAEGHFQIAQALGRLSRTRGGKERVRFARIIYDEANRAVALDSTHDGACHVLGAWHAEIKRLPGFTKFFAKTLFGAGFMDQANWPDAVEFLERAVALKPEHVFHRLELAEVYIDVGRFAAAREQLTAIASLPVADVLDPLYKQDAVELLDEIRNEKDRT